MECIFYFNTFITAGGRETSEHSNGKIRKSGAGQCKLVSESVTLRKLRLRNNTSLRKSSFRMARRAHLVPQGLLQ
jgi:hypothetical protein